MSIATDDYGHWHLATIGLGLLTPKEVRAAKLTTHRFCEGYNTDEVDDLLDACADTIETLTRALESIMQRKSQ